LQQQESNKTPNGTSINKNGPSRSAEGIALIRLGEQRYPVDQRICNDQYALYFINPGLVKYISEHPKEVEEITEEHERRFPGLNNTTVARVRYFDDCMKSALSDGIEQLVILGAGYDTRAYRIEGANKIKVFEVDHPDTQSVKVEKIKGIFGALPRNVAYVAVDLATDDLGRRLAEHGYDVSKKTLFLMEGLVMYLPADAVDRILEFVVLNSGKGSSVVFDYVPESVANGTCTDNAGRDFGADMAGMGEPFRFGIKEGTVEAFLARRGFSRIRDVTPEEIKKLYFHGENEHRQVSGLILIASGVVE